MRKVPFDSDVQCFTRTEKCDSVSQEQRSVSVFHKNREVFQCFTQEHGCNVKQCNVISQSLFNNSWNLINTSPGYVRFATSNATSTTTSIATNTATSTTISIATNTATNTATGTATSTVLLNCVHHFKFSTSAHYVCVHDRTGNPGDANERM